VVATARVWVATIALLGTGVADNPFITRLIFIIALASFLLSAQGIEPRIYARFMLVIVAGTLSQLNCHYPAFMEDLGVVADIAFPTDAPMLLVCGCGAHRRTLEWARPPVNQRMRPDQLNLSVREELRMHEALRQRSVDLESTKRKLAELATRDGLTGMFRRGHMRASCVARSRSGSVTPATSASC
jgi:hypothetical protein